LSGSPRMAFSFERGLYSIQIWEILSLGEEVLSVIDLELGVGINEDSFRVQLLPGYSHLMISRELWKLPITREQQLCWHILDWRLQNKRQSGRFFERKTSVCGQRIKLSTWTVRLMEKNEGSAGTSQLHFLHN
jgi:hypothetical protein